MNRNDASSLRSVKSVLRKLDSVCTGVLVHPVQTRAADQTAEQPMNTQSSTPVTTLTGFQQTKPGKACVEMEGADKSTVMAMIMSGNQSTRLEEHQRESEDMQLLASMASERVAHSGGGEFPHAQRLVPSGGHQVPLICREAHLQHGVQHAL